MAQSPQPAGVEWRDEGVHYLRAVTDMADHSLVMTNDAIYTHKGIKLVDKGTRIDSRMYERLALYPLRYPVDWHLSTDDLVDVAELEATALAQCQTVELIQRLVLALGDVERLLAPIRGIVLESRIAFKLTVMREQRNELFLHSLQMGLVAIYLALQSGKTERECISLATAALLHDMGMLHMDPAWTDASYRLTSDERRQLVAHSVTSMLMVRSAETYSQAVELAILEHHERMDGSGYPRGVQGRHISSMGQMLMLAEVISAFFEKFPELPGQRLSLMLRMNHQRYPAHLVRIILPLLYDEITPGTPLQPLQAEVSHSVNALSAAFQMWATLSQGFPELWQSMPDHQAAVFVDSSLGQLQKQLAEAGAHPDQQTDLWSCLKDDVQGLKELALVHREALWQLQSIVDKCLQQWPSVSLRENPVDVAVVQWCEACMQIPSGRPQAQVPLAEPTP
ncbi:MAG: HD domain-containing protein [Comamonas sp.]|nr:HD domain-containing protein [Comamonas sp.]